MIEQEITVQLSDDPFDTKTIKVLVPPGTKILSTAPYVADVLEMYGLSESVEKQLHLCEDTQSYTTQGEIVEFSLDREGNKITAIVDLGTKYTATCNLLKEPKHIVEQLEEGIVVDVKVKPGKNGNVIASISDAIDEVKMKEIMGAIGDKSIGFTGKVTELLHGGYWVEVGGIQCFMPGSLAGLNKLYDFNSLIGKEIIVMPISFSNEKETIIVSHREYLRTLIPSAIESARENIKDHLTGFVTGTTKFGIFAEFNECLTGLIPLSDVDEDTLTKFNNREIKPGDDISFWIKEIISERKIILSQTGPKENIWDDANDKYKPMMITPGKVTKVTKYGAFVELEKGISGLIHKSKLKEIELTKGDVVNVKIQSINASDRKITMNLAEVEG